MLVRAKLAMSTFIKSRTENIALRGRRTKKIKQKLGNYKYDNYNEIVPSKMSKSPAELQFSC